MPLIKKRTLPSLLLLIVAIKSNYASAEGGISVNRDTVKDTSYFSLCDTSQSEIFSCQGQVNKVVSLCMTPADKKIEVKTKLPNGETQMLAMGDIHQDISIASGGGSTILRGVTKDGLATLYLDSNRADENGSAVVLPDNSIVNCNTNSIRTPSSTIKSPEGKDQIINIWLLKNKGITKDFAFAEGNEKKKFKEKMSLWKTWPK